MNKPSSFSWRPKTTVILLGGFAIILIAIMVSFITTNFKPTTQVKIGSGVYHVWLADDEYKRTQGLSGIDKLEINGGMLFDFKEDGLWGIWMKDMLIPIDIVWIDRDKQVVFIRQDASPALGDSVIMTPKKPARYVLELPAGSVKKAGIKVGERAEFTVQESAE